VDDNKNALAYPILVTITGRKSVAIQALAISQIYDQNEFLGSPAYNKNVSVSLKMVPLSNLPLATFKMGTFDQFNKNVFKQMS
jgi:hypothetical protein